MDNIGTGFRTRLIPSKGVDYARAPIYKRAIAFGFDILIINFLIMAPFEKIILPFFENAKFADIQGALPDIIYTSVVMISILALLYFSLLQHYERQTIGMMIMKLYVVPQTGFLRSVVRNLFILPFFPFSLLWVIEPVALFWKKRRLLEKLTATNTVEVLNG